MRVARPPRIGALVLLVLLVLLASAAIAHADDDAGPKPPFEGDPGSIGAITVAGGGYSGSLVTGTFAPSAGTATWKWGWGQASAPIVSGCKNGDEQCVIRVPASPSVAYKFDSTTGRWELNNKTISGWSTMSVTKQDPGEYPDATRDWFKVLAGGPPPSCLSGGIDVPTPRIIRGAWSLIAEVSPDDGLVVRDVKLGERMMAAQMSLPYYHWSIAGLGSGRGELIPTGSQGTGRSRLLAFDVAQRPQGVAITATFGVEELPGGACIEVTQQYLFADPVAGDHCEPAGKLPCARFEPTVSFRVLRPPEGVAADGMTLRFPQRLEFVDDAAIFNAAALSRDQDGPLSFREALDSGIPAFSAPIIRSAANPLTSEIAATVIRGGTPTASGPGAWDNFHQTYFCEVQLPRAFAPEKVTQGRPFGEWLAVPGCPECIHVHWRWGAPSAAAPGFGDANAGRPRIPDGSQQDVTIGVVRVPDGGAGGSEADPSDWQALANAEPLGASATDGRVLPAPGRRARIAFWYEGASRQKADAFMTHGGFFAVDQPGKPVVREAAIRPTAFLPASAAQSSAAAKPRRARGAKLRFRLSEWGALAARIEQDRPGTRVGRRCVARGKGQRGKPCRRTVVLGRFFEDGGTDRSAITFTGRVGSKALPPGSYRLTVHARDLSGDLSAARGIAFRILRR